MTIKITNQEVLELEEYAKCNKDKLLYIRLKSCCDCKESKKLKDFYKDKSRKEVSGLHVPWNLQVIPAIDNLKKKNKV